MKIKLTEEVWKEGSMFIAYCPELDIPACGATIAEAKKNLIEVINIQISEMKTIGMVNSDFKKLLCEV